MHADLHGCPLTRLPLRYAPPKRMAAYRGTAACHRGKPRSFFSFSFGSASGNLAAQALPSVESACTSSTKTLVPQLLCRVWLLRWPMRRR